VLCAPSSRREAFFALNSDSHNAPCCNSQAILMYQVARHALERGGVVTLATGDHADSLFLGFDRFFRGFPNDPANFSRAIASLDGPGKLARVLPKPGAAQQPDRLIRAMGAGDDDRIAWNEKIYAADYKAMSKWV